MARYTSIAVGFAATLWILVQVRPVLEPVLVAVFLWFMLKAVATAWTRMTRGRGVRPSKTATALSALVFISVLIGLALMVGHNANTLRAQLPSYEANLNASIASAATALGLDDSFKIGDLLGQVSFSTVLVQIAGTAASFLTGAIIIVIYIIFLVIESGVARQKLAALVPDHERRREVATLLGRINAEIETYLGIKLFLGLVQGVPTFVVLKLVGVDAAGFWAVVVFFFSFIPTIGSLVGIIFPSLMALVQFSDLQPFLIVVSVLAVVQVWASNWLEPALMARSLNLSPLAVFVAIFAGGAIWGIVGALIVVPLLAIATIVFAQIPSMRPVAILLSRDGSLDVVEAEAASDRDPA